MAITVYKFPQPYLELELVAGGSLPINDYYFLGWFQRHGAYYHCASGPVSEEQSITTTSGYQSIKCSWWTNHSDITQFSDGGSGQVIVTSVGHGLNENDSVKIINTTNYNGTFTATNITDDTFEITTTWVSDDATGTWLNDNSIPEYVTESYETTSGINFKWDNYSMIDSSTGKPYKWLNMNDPNNIGKDEWDDISGHRKWGQQYYEVKYNSGGSNTWTSYANGSGTSVLKDGIIQGTSYAGRGGDNIQIAHKNNISNGGWLMDDRWSNLTSKLHIKIDDTDTNNNWDDLINALKASGYDDNYILYYKDYYCVGLDLMGSYDGDGVGTWTNILLNSSGAWRCPNITYDNCQLRWLPCQSMSRTSPSLTGIFKNTSFFYNGTSLDIDPDYATADGLSPYGSSTFYSDCIGYTFSQGDGGYIAGYTFFQYRYPNKLPSIMTDVITNGMYCYITYLGSSPIKTMNIERLTANNNGIINYDFDIAYSSMDGKDCEFTWDCLDVASNRDDGKIILRYRQLSDAASFSDIWYSRYNINLTIVDEDGTPIEGAEISLIGDETSTDISDVDGLAIVTQLGYTITCPQDLSTYYVFGVASDWKKSDLTITKEGYQTYILKDIEIREGQDWTISLIQTKELAYTF